MGSDDARLWLVFRFEGSWSTSSSTTLQKSSVGRVRKKGGRCCPAILSWEGEGGMQKNWSHSIPITGPTDCLIGLVRIFRRTRNRTRHGRQQERSAARTPPVNQARNRNVYEIVHGLKVGTLLYVGRRWNQCQHNLVLGGRRANSTSTTLSSLPVPLESTRDKTKQMWTTTFP
jgi:hypothetical protein